MSASLKSSKLLVFYLLTYIITWSFWLAAVLGSRGASPGASPFTVLGWVLLYLGIFTPAFVALGLTARSAGQGGVVELLRRLIAWEVPVRWYGFAVGYLVVIKLVSAALYRAVTGAWPAFGSSAWYLLLLATAFSTMIGGQAGEELGWRGYALPRLAARFGFGWAGIVVGLFWALWHLPLFYIPGADTFGQSLPLYVVQVTGISVAMTWLYTHTNGSLLLAMLMHSALNNMSPVVPAVPRPFANPLLPVAPLLGWLTAGVVWAAALYFLVRMPSAVPSGSRSREPQSVGHG